MSERFLRLVVLGLLLMVGSGCSEANWPPAPRNTRERRMIESAQRAAEQIDGWTQTACLVEAHEGKWRVQVWRIVNPAAHGRSRCVPWAVRGVTLDDDAKVLAYENHVD